MKIPTEYIKCNCNKKIFIKSINNLKKSLILHYMKF